MGARFTAASTQCLANSSPTITGYPFVMGAWVYTTDVAASYCVFCFTASNSLVQEIDLEIGIATFKLIATAATSSNATSTIVPAAGKWYHVMCRAISATSRWIIVFDPTVGLVDQVQDVTSKAPTFTTPRVGVGGLPGTSLVLSSNNIIAEFFYMDSDFKTAATGAALSGGYVQKLAMEGPFSVNDIQDSIVEYRSLLDGSGQAPPADQISTGSVYSRVGLTTWANPFTAANVPTAGPHSPYLTTNYVRPGQIRPIVVI
jgi:hypothetical protein